MKTDKQLINHINFVAESDWTDQPTVYNLRHATGLTQKLRMIQTT